METEMICMIPARSGSKGLPGKNLSTVCGRSLIEWAILQGLTAGVGPLLVVTDDRDVMTVASRFGAAVYEEPSHIASDGSSLEDVMCWTVEQYHQQSGTLPGWLMVIQPTSPLRLTSDLISVRTLSRAGDFDSIFSAVRTHHCSWRERELELTAEWPQDAPLERKLRQDCGRQFTENGAIYAVRLSAFKRTRFVGRIAVYEMPLWTAWQVDTPDELALIELIMRTRLQLGSDGVRT